MTFPVVYQPASRAASGPTPGAKALMAWCLANYPPGTNLGIYNPRNVRGGAALSLHAEGRAIDVGYPTMRPDGYPMGQLLAAHMAQHHAELGVQCVIFARRIWSNTRPAWRLYNGAADHYDHVHIELTREAAAGLTTDIIRQTLEATTVPTTPTQPTGTERDLIGQWQGQLIANGARLGDAGPNRDGKDGVFLRLTLDASTTVLNHRNQLLAQVATQAERIDRMMSDLTTVKAERDAAKAEQGRLGQQLQEAHTDVARLQALADVATRAPALLAILQGLRVQLDEAVAKLQGLA